MIAGVGTVGVGLIACGSSWGFLRGVGRRSGQGRDRPDGHAWADRRGLDQSQGSRRLVRSCCAHHGRDRIGPVCVHRLAAPSRDDERPVKSGRRSAQGSAEFIERAASISRPSDCAPDHDGPGPPRDESDSPPARRVPPRAAGGLTRPGPRTAWTSGVREGPATRISGSHRPQSSIELMQRRGNRPTANRWFLSNVNGSIT
jgi:hypothetical protein